jgi:hypothetical protein
VVLLKGKECKVERKGSENAIRMQTTGYLCSCGMTVNPTQGQNLPANLETTYNWVGESDSVIMIGEQTRILSVRCEISEWLLLLDGPRHGNKAMQPHLYMGARTTAACLKTEYIPLLLKPPSHETGDECCAIEKRRVINKIIMLHPHQHSI